MKTFFLLLAFASLACAATIHGTAFDWRTFRPVAGTFFSINSTPAQSLVSANGSYSFEVGAGTYALEANSFHQNLSARQEFSVPSQGNFLIDLILLPLGVTEEDLYEGSHLLPPLPREENNYALLLVVIAVVAVTAIAVLFIMLPKLRKKDFLKKEEAPAKQEVAEKNAALPKDLKELLEKIKEHEGRTTQKELRKEIPLSEAKVSLMISDLEDRGLVKKIKKGRGNIIRIV
jgi:uncharacterized membrane protein